MAFAEQPLDPALSSPLEADEPPANPYRTEPPEYDLNPWTWISLRPRATIAQILEDQSNEKPTIPMPVLVNGFGQAILGAAMQSSEDPSLFGPRLVSKAISGVIGGIIYWLYMSWAINITARWLGGISSPNDMRLAVGWGLIPTLYSLPFYFFLPWEVPATIGSVWQGIVMAKCVGEAHEFSAWRGMGAIVLAGLIFFAPIILVFWAIIVFAFQ